MAPEVNVQAKSHRLFLPVLAYSAAKELNSGGQQTWQTCGTRWCRAADGGQGRGTEAKGSMYGKEKGSVVGPRPAYQGTVF
jgi:hypothetical protein